MKKQAILSKLVESGVVAVVRASSAEEAVKISEACIEGGINAIEVTFTVDYAHDVIKELKKQVKAIAKLGVPSGVVLNASDLDAYFVEVLASGKSSFCYLQNVYTTKNLKEQGLSLALCLADGYLAGKKAAYRVHGGGFAGTIQAYVPMEDVDGFRALMDGVFGEGKCIVLRIRPEGAVRIA